MNVLRMADLRITVILLVLLPLLLVFGVGGLVALEAVEKRLEVRLQEDILLIARTLQLPMSHALELQRDGAIDQAMRSASDFGRVYGVYVYDADGNLVTQADSVPYGGTPRGVSSELRQLQKQDHLGDYRSMGGQDVFSLFTPLTGAGGQVIGMLQITRQVSEMRRYINELRWRVVPVLLAFSGAFIVAVIAGHYIVIGRPLRRLSQSMDRVAAGNIQVRPVPGGPRELHRLGERFNLMLDGIKERDENLEVQRQIQSRLSDRLRQSEKYALAGRLAAGLAHELGAPLSVIDGHVQRLLRQRSRGTAEHDALTKVREAAGRMAEVVQHLLGFGRLSSTQDQQVLFKRLVALAVADVRTLYQTSSTELRIEPGSPEAKVMADERRLREALTHLLKNALHSARGGLVKIGWRATDASASLFVEDSGAGIDEEDRERIFEPFFTTKDPGQGSGLGLAVVRGTVVDSGAEISVYNSLLGGAGFRIDFCSSLAEA